MLEAAASGKAIVSTSLGAEGLEFQPGRDILIADSYQGFADAVLSLVADAGRRHRLGERAPRWLAGTIGMSSARDCARPSVRCGKGTRRSHVSRGSIQHHHQQRQLRPIPAAGDGRRGLHQTYSNVEVVVVDDGSTDDSARSYKGTAAT